MKRFSFPKAPLIRLSGTILGLTLLAGCINSERTAGSDSPAGIAVTYQDSPVAGLEIWLLDSPNGRVVSRSITLSDGIARFDPPSQEPEEYFVSLESLGDGGWVLQPRVVAPFIEQTTLKPFAVKPVQSIELPASAIRILSP